MKKTLIITLLVTVLALANADDGLSVGGASNGDSLYVAKGHREPSPFSDAPQFPYTGSKDTSFVWGILLIAAIGACSTIEKTIHRNRREKKP